MQKQLQQLLQAAIRKLQSQGVVPGDLSPEIGIERTRDKKHGDFASNVALSLARPARRNPRELAQAIVDALPATDAVSRVEIAGPGFINFTMNDDARRGIVRAILEQNDAYGRSQIGKGRRIQVEFVSANPTGPLHVGHGRGAAYGAAVADLLSACGFSVEREYYVNDAGRQMAILACSVWLRYLEICGESFTFPSNGYRGAYIKEISQSVADKHGEAFRYAADIVFSNIPADADGQGNGDKEAHIDALIERCHALLGDENYAVFADAALENILGDIRDDLGEFGVEYEHWYREHTLVNSGKVEAAINHLRDAGHLYEADGAWWFRSTAFGDEKDRVVIRENGQLTYFATDIAYHAEKIERGFDQIIDVWGADHHGYVPRIRASLQAMGHDPERLEVLLVQFAILYRHGQKAQMSTRSGEFVTLRELRDEVGNDAARFFYVLRKCEQHMDFDLDLAVSKSNENPVYYIQYAHARVCSVMRQLAERGLDWNETVALASLDRLQETHEEDLLDTLARFPEIVEASALNREPHQLAYYLRDLATALHTYYNAHQFLVDDIAVRNARLALILATRQVLKNGLRLLSVSAPESM
ncbi:MAG: arginine--tRNA ligase [Gammaproteobacteria bacterium]|nr:arginine--tRNA ligase [Gammaproteobacteria bacterium]